MAGGGSDTRRFVYAPDDRVMGEYGANASDVRAEFIWMSPEVGDAGQFGGDDGLGGYMPLAVSTPDPIAGAGATQLSWVHANHMGVPLRYSDAAGQALTLPTSYSVPGFPGQSQTFSDLYYNRYRDYDSSTGRYIQADPIGLAGGPSPYSYAMNNPLRYTDPTGEFVPLFTCGIGFVAGGVATAAGELILNGETSVSHVLVGAAAGCLAGAAAPVVASSVAGSAVLSGVTNVGQYIATQVVDGKAITPGGLALNAGLGVLVGRLSGAFKPRGMENSLDVFPWQQLGTRELHRGLNEQAVKRAAMQSAAGSSAYAVGATVASDQDFWERFWDSLGRIF